MSDRGAVSVDAEALHSLRDSLMRFGQNVPSIEARLSRYLMNVDEDIQRFLRDSKREIARLEEELESLLYDEDCEDDIVALQNELRDAEDRYKRANKLAAEFRTEEQRLSRYTSRLSAAASREVTRGAGVIGTCVEALNSYLGLDVSGGTAASVRDASTLGGHATSCDRNDHYSDVLAGRYAGANALAKRVFDKYDGEISIIDGDFADAPRYDSERKGISMSFSYDADNPRGAGSTYFHEVGHMIDNLAGGGGSSWASTRNTEFGDAIVSDVNQAISAHMVNQGTDRDQACEEISDLLNGDTNHSLSDLFGAATDGRCQGDYGHDVRYWQNRDNIAIEAFAHMFEASMNDDASKLRRLERYLPNAHAAFIRIMEGL